MNITTRNVLPAALSLMAALALTGCATGASYSDLDRESTLEDAMPPGLLDQVGDKVEPKSSRLVGHDGDTELYLARGGKLVCLVAYVNDADWVMGCGSADVDVDGTPGRFFARPDGSSAPIDGTVAISKNVWRAE